MQIVIDHADLEPIIAQAVDRALELFATGIRESIATNNQTGLLTTRQAAKLLGVCEKTVVNHVTAGRLVATRLGGSVRFAQADIDAFIASNRATA